MIKFTRPYGHPNGDIQFEISGIRPKESSYSYIGNVLGWRQREGLTAQDWVKGSEFHHLNTCTVDWDELNKRELVLYETFVPSYWAKNSAGIGCLYAGPMAFINDCQLEALELLRAALTEWLPTLDDNDDRRRTRWVAGLS